MPEPSFTDIIRAYLEAQFGGDVPPAPGITIDSELSDTSENPVQNKVITAALALKAALTDIPQLATRTDMSDWTQGKTVDAATLKTDFQNALQSLTLLQLEVSDLQGDVPRLQTKAITDTGGYYTTDTVDGALQEIGAELAGVNTLLGSGVIT